MQSRRARKSYEQWAELAADDTSGFTMEAFCLHKNLAMSTFQRWRTPFIEPILLNTVVLHRHLPK